jgi:hypothetical protein
MHTKTVASSVIVLILVTTAYFGYTKNKGQPAPACSGSRPIFIPTNGGELLVGKIHRTQKFQTRHILTILNIPIPACHIDSSITISPFTGYKVKLEKQWEIRMRDGEKEIIVIAPPITPDLPVPFDTSGIVKAVSGCPMINSQSTLDSLEKRLSEELKKHAESQEYINIARNQGREVVAKFVRNWIVKQRQYERAENYVVKVFFKGESIAYY